MKETWMVLTFILFALVIVTGCGGEGAVPGSRGETPMDSAAAGSESAMGTVEQASEVSDSSPAAPEAAPAEPPAPVENLRDRLGLVYEAEASRTVNGRPVFEYNPLSDIRAALAAQDFRVLDGTAPGDPELHFQFSEVQFPGYYFQLLDGSGRKLLEERVFLVGGQSYVRETLGRLVRDRLAQPGADEVAFLVGQVKSGRTLGYPVDRRALFNNLNHLLRLYELTDSRAIDTFVTFLRSCDPRQRLIAKFALVNLGFIPRNPGEQAEWDMVNTLDGRNLVSMNFLREPEVTPESPGEFGGSLRLRSFIGQHGAVGIDLLVDDVRCNIMVPNVGWYGGGQVTEVRPELILSSLTEEAWRGSEWDPEWSAAVKASLERVLQEDHPELTEAQESEFREFATRVLASLEGVGGEYDI